MQKILENAERELEKAKEDAGRSSAETERLLQLVQMTQEEQNSKEKQIRELQEYVYCCLLFIKLYKIAIKFLFW